MLPQERGGVGKTTATANLGMSIARLGHRVALIDADIGLRNLDRCSCGLENRILYTAMDILEGQCRLDQALIRDKAVEELVSALHLKEQATIQLSLERTWKTL